MTTRPPGRLLITACTATKRRDAGLLPAVVRYDGPSVRVLRRALRALPEASRPDVLFLSARFGLIPADTPIPAYDQRMTRPRALELRPQSEAALRQWLDRHGPYRATLINLGADYLPALELWPANRPRLGRETFTAGGIGVRLGQLKRWLSAAERAVPRLD